MASNDHEITILTYSVTGTARPTTARSVYKLYTIKIFV